MLLFSIDRASDVPAYRQICDRVIALADGGVLKPGDRLPPTRKLAETTGLHRSSVVRAYNELRALGYLESLAGSYTTVRRRERPPTARSAAADIANESLIDWQVATRPTVRALRNHAAMEPARAIESSDLIDLDRLCADPSLAPDDDLRRCLNHALIRTGGTALDYADAAGWRPLRELIAARMCSHGAAVSADEVLVTTGAQQALDLLLRFQASPGDRIVVEAPTYGMAHALLKLHDLESVEVPMREDGMDLDCLQQVLQSRGQRPRLVFTMPNFHNPTGITTDQQHRERLLTLCETHRVPLVEDGFEEEMKYFGRAVLPVKSMDRHGIVLYVGTFSKVVFPGLRLGWIAAPSEVIGRLADIAHASCIAGNTLAQVAVAKFCAGGGFESHLRRIHRVYRRRMRALLQGLEQHMPATVQWTRPSGGYTAWLTAENSQPAGDQLLERILREGVKVGPGRRYFAEPPEHVHFRLSIACATEEQIETGCRLIGRVLDGAS
jgi:DNA-binding transcriptional MocR family regulator